ncbi:hypothetical protein VDIAB_110595 [Vibrio diabolicus]|nr:hypothetical protein VDIAB_110595 [Vibrio diabolicus]
MRRGSAIKTQKSSQSCQLTGYAPVYFISRYTTRRFNALHQARLDEHFSSKYNNSRHRVESVKHYE